MKRVTLILVTLTFILSLQASTKNNIINTILAEKHLDCVTVPRLLMKVVPGAKDAGVHSIKILNAEKCSKKTIDKISSSINKGQIDDFETIVATHDKDDNTLVVAKQKGENLTELLIINVEGDEVSLVNIKGKLSLDKAKEWADKDFNGILSE